MGRFDVGVIRYLQKEHFRVLISVEMGMKNHELVPLQLVASVAGIHRGAAARSLSDLQKHRLVAYERGKRADGYRLTTTGYDFLALKALCSRNVVGSVGNQIGVGKESDVYVGGDPELNDLVLKFHRLGRTSFRKLKEKRDYHRGRRNCSWLYLARLAANKEYAFLKALHSHKFPVPRPIDISRHTVVMELIDGLTLCHVHSVQDVETLYDELMTIIVRLGRYGLIHGDFNEFNIVLNSKERPILIDFPQMVSMDHPNAEFYFNRDVECIRSFFKKRFEYESELFPKFEDVERRYNLDVEVAASGFTKQMAKDLNAAYDAGDYTAIEAELSSSTEESDHDDEEYASEGSFSAEELKICKGQTRLDAWLEDAKNHLEDLKFLADEECSTLTSEDKEITPLADIITQQATNSQSIPDDEGVFVNRKDVMIKPESISEEVIISKHAAPSIYSTGSTFSHDEIRRRIALEQRSKNKTKLRIKGKANAVRRGRKNNMSIIKEYDGWEF